MSCSTAGITAAGSNAGSTARRQNMPSETTMKALTVVGMSSAGAMRPSACSFGEQLLEALGDVAVDALEDLADARVARRLQADLDAHAVAVRRLLQEVLLAQRPQRFQEVRRGGQRVETLGELLPVALGDAGDQRFFAVEVDVERAGADAASLQMSCMVVRWKPARPKHCSAASRMCSRRAR